MVLDFLYLKPGGTKLEAYTLVAGNENSPPIPPGMVRVVAISDTHNETKHLLYPFFIYILFSSRILSLLFFPTTSFLITTT